MKKLLCKVLSLVIMLTAAFALASCGDDPVTPDPDNNNTNGTAVPQTVYFLKDGASEYSIAYSNDSHKDYADLLYAIFSEAGCTVNRYVYGDASADKEIVIGDTDRQISADLKAAAEALKTNENDFVWAYGYKDGKLGFYANSEKALELGWEAFKAEVKKDSTIECKDDLWVSGIKTYSEYQAELEAEIAAQDKGVEKQIIRKLMKFSASYTAKWGTSIKAFPTSYNTTIKPTSQHPRVWVNEDSLETVIANLTHEDNIEQYEHVKAVADAALLEDGGLADSSNNWSVAAAEKMQSLAFMYLVTGRAKYGYGAMLHAFNLIDTLKLPSASHTNGNKSGTAMYMLAEVYDWCYDLFTPEQRTSFINGVCNNISKYFEFGYPPPANAGAIDGHSTETPLLRNWLAFGIAVYNECPEIYNFVAGKIIDEFVPGVNFFYKSGVHHQGSSYGTSPRLYAVLASSLLMKAATGIDIYDTDFNAMIMTHINRLRPDMEALKIGDFHVTTTGYDGAMKMAFYAGALYKNTVAKAWYEDADLAINYSATYTEITPVSYLIFNDPYVVATDKFDLELVHYNPAPSGSVVARSAWGDPDAWMTYTNIKVAYEGNHDHKDAGTFQIYYKGILAPDTGAYQYGSDQAYNSLYDHAYVKMTISKNGLLIYNPGINSSGTWVYSGGQTLGGLGSNGDFGNLTLEEWQSRSSINQAAVLGYSSAADGDGLVYTYISGDITKAYDASTVRLATRSTMTLPTGDESAPMAFIVYDRIISMNADFEKSFVLHTTNKPVFGNGQEGTDITAAVSGKKNWVGFKKVTGTSTFCYNNILGPSGSYTADDPNDKYNGQLTVQTLLPEDPTYYYTGGDGKRFWYNGNSLGKEYITEYPDAEIGWGRVEIVPSAASTDDTFLNVMYVSDAGITVTEQAQLVSGATHDGVVTYGSCVMFARSSQTAITYTYKATDDERMSAVQSTLVSDTVSFDTTGKAQGDLNYYVGGLAEGTWTVSVGGVTKTVTVTAEGAIAVFEAPAGQLTMTRAQ